MQVNARQIDSVNAGASVEISKQSIKNEVEKLAKKASKNVKMNGFRTGKVPLNAVLKKYEKELTNDAEQNLFKNAVDKALKDIQKDTKDLVGEPYFEKFERKDGNIEAELVFSFKPEFSLEGYEKFIPSYDTPKISKKEIEERKTNLLKRFASQEKIQEERGLKNGDFAKFDFEGFVDGVAFDGGKAENFVLEIGSKQFIPGFEEGMIDIKAGEEKDINVTFPKDYNVANLAGKEAVFKIKLHEILELKLPELNDDLLKKILPNTENPSEENLNDELKKQLENEKIFKLINEELKAKFADDLINNFNFDLPRGIVEQETDLQFRNAFASFDEKEREELNKDIEKAKAKRESFKEEATKSVKLTFIVDELAKIRNIKVSDQEVIQAVYFEAYRMGAEPRAYLENYRRQGILPAVKMALIEEKLFNDIFSAQLKTEEKTTQKPAKKEKKEEK